MIEFSSNKFKIFCLSKLARQRNWDSRPDTWQQPQEQMALPRVEGKRFKVKHKSISNCAGDSWALLYHFKPEKPSGWKFYLWRQRPPAECRHSLVTPVQCTSTCSHECPVQSGWSHTVCTALPNLLLWLHWRQQLFWQRPVSSFCPLWHRYQLYERNPTPDLHFPHISEMHKKAPCPFHFWHIYNKTQNAAIPTALKKQLQSEATLWLKYQMETKECNFSLCYTHLKTVHNRIIFWTYHLT